MELDRSLFVWRDPKLFGFPEGLRPHALSG